MFRKRLSDLLLVICFWGPAFLVHAVGFLIWQPPQQQDLQNSQLPSTAVCRFKLLVAQLNAQAVLSVSVLTSGSGAAGSEFPNSGSRCGRQPMVSYDLTAHVHAQHFCLDTAR